MRPRCRRPSRRAGSSRSSRSSCSRLPRRTRRLRTRTRRRSLQNLFPAAPQKLLIVATTALGTIGALALELTSFQSFLFLLGSFFVPLFAVLLADWLLAGRTYDAGDVFGGPAWRPGMIAAWVVGFGTYQWLSPTGPAWWVEQVERLIHPPGGSGRRCRASSRRSRSGRCGGAVAPGGRMRSPPKLTSTVTPVSRRFCSGSRSTGGSPSSTDRDRARRRHARLPRPDLRRARVATGAR